MDSFRWKKKKKAPDRVVHNEREDKSSGKRVERLLKESGHCGRIHEIYIGIEANNGEIGLDSGHLADTETVIKFEVESCINNQMRDGLLLYTKGSDIIIKKTALCRKRISLPVIVRRWERPRRVVFVFTGLMI